MPIKAKVPFLLSLVFLVILCKETQGRCSSCPSNNCTQTEMSQGKCFRARYYTTTDVVSYYTTVYNQETSQGSYKTKCGLFNWRRCTRYRIVYHQRSRLVQKYIIAERENLACDAYCCLQDEVLHEENCYSDGNVQLVGGTTTREGRVEIWYNSQWNTICDDLWDINDAHVVCRQLGYEGAVTAHHSAHFGQGSGQILLDDLQCTGREGSLLECNHNGINEHNCRHGEDASVTCSTSSFTSGTVRLTNGYAPSVGRVEIWYSEQWNTVCDDSWSITDARVVCRQLGYQGAALAHPNAYFGEGSGGIILDNLDCTGAETSLLQCTHNGLYSHNCDHDEDAGVTCGCGDPGVVSDGVISTVSGTAVGDTVTYTCRHGYTLSGSNTRTCQPNGFWSDDVPRCIGSCGTPRSLINGQRHYTSTAVGSTVTYTCNTGYTMTAGSSRRTCQSNHEWSGDHPTCKRYCGDPGTPVNGMRSISGYTEGHTVTYTCNEGYELAGSATRTCQSNGLWSGSSATCPTEDCGTPSSLLNGQRLYSSTTFGSTVTYICNTGYVMTAGSSSRACPSNGQWSGSHPTCTRYCGDPGTPVNGMRSISGYTEGHTVTYTCNEGYELAGSATRTCQSNGLWSGSSATCPTVDCGTPSSLSNGQRRYSSTTFGSTVTYTCNTGYLRTAGSSSRMCQSNGVWSGSHPNCTPVDCGTPRSLSNGQRRYSSTTFGSTVTYTCNTGYRMTAGSSSRTCQSNGLWSGTHPTCTPVNCGTPRSLSNGQRHYTSTTFGYTVTYTCNTGYRMTAGSSSRTCQSNGQWSGTHPNCTPVDCGTPSSLSNGQRRYSSTTFGSTVTYTCDPGYLRTAGSSSGTCQSNGQWSGSHPTCTPVDCGTPSSSSNGQRHYTSTTFGSTVTYTCNTGYLMTAGSSSRMCQSNGEWSGSHPNCTRSEPPSKVTGVSLTRYLRRGRPSLIVRWTAPQSDALISRYKIQYKRTGAVFWGSEAATVGSPPPTKVTLISLAVGTNYTVRVSATSSNGRGEWSEEQTERTYRCPSKVTNVSLAVFEATSLNVTWAIPQSDMPITQYQVQYRTDEVPSWNSTPPLSGSPPPSSTVLNGMHSGYDYILRVRAMSVVGAGEWSEEQTQRIGNVCSKPEGPANGGVASTGNIEGDTASYFCNSGFTRFGDRIRTCQSDGQWSGTQPQCNRTCDEPQSPANGGKNSTGNTEGQMVNYFCNPGFKLSGDKNRTCQSDGQWSGSQPLCIDITCEPQSPANGGKVTTGSSVGDTVSYFCNPGFKLSGDRYGICKPDGQWSGSQPNCSRYCDPPVAPSNGDKIYSGNVEGDTVTYFCNKRYKLYGDVNRTCQSNGEWSGIQPRCDEILDGGWSHWVNGTCSITCGGEGVRVDTRTCDNPPPQNGGKDCYGSPNRTGPCFTCPCEGGWSSWSSEPCSRTCGGGTRNRSRNCTTPNHLDCCPGNNTDVETCGEISCPIDGGWSPWIKASNCSVLCGGGVQLFVRKCNNPVPANGGKDCEGPKSKNETCAYCPCKGGWSPWSPGPCSHTCGNGTRTSTRNCTTPDHPDCCPGNSTMVETCVEDSCPGWIKVTNCSVECGGGGIQVFVRDCPAFASGGKLCEVPTHKIEYCGYCPCEGGWSPWSRGPCSHTCGNGTRTNTRNCTTPDHPDCCPGNSTMVETCSEGNCPSCSPCTWTVAWPCSKTCGGKGMQVLVRECNGGKPCEGPSHKVEPCGYCPCEGGWSRWSHGPCSHTCGNGTRTSTRNCTTPDHPDCCPGNSTMAETCSEGSCAIHGNWSDWREVLPCNKPCGGGGARVLMRECNNPEPANGGNDCVGEGLKIDYTCADCPCEGGWSPWSHGPCSHKCGKGTRTSTRNCTTPDHPDCCPGNSTIIEACEERKCSVVAVDGGWSSWQEAIACTATCGGGTRYLTRRCNNPTPANGGRDCEGDTIKADICAECPCDAHWASWTQGICSGPCGQNGTAVATRKCNGPSQCCRGKRTRTETCTSRPC